MWDNCYADFIFAEVGDGSLLLFIDTVNFNRIWWFAKVLRSTSLRTNNIVFLNTYQCLKAAVINDIPQSSWEEMAVISLTFCYALLVSPWSILALTLYLSCIESLPKWFAIPSILRHTPSDFDRTPTDKFCHTSYNRATGFFSLCLTSVLLQHFKGVSKEYSSPARQPRERLKLNYPIFRSVKLFCSGFLNLYRC